MGWIATCCSVRGFPIICPCDGSSYCDCNVGAPARVLKAAVRRAVTQSVGVPYRDRCPRVGGVDGGRVSMYTPTPTTRSITTIIPARTIVLFFGLGGSVGFAVCSNFLT